MINIIARALLMSTPLLIGATAEVIAERAGVMIIAVEGIFLIGAWGGFVGVYTTGSYLMGFFLAALLGLCVALIYGWITIILKQHQIVTGTALNIFIAGIVAFFHRVIFGVPLLPLTIEPLEKLPIPLLSKIPVIGGLLFDQSILTYIAFLLALAAYFILFKTAVGLVIRSVGENPVAVDVVGISVEKVRMLVILIAGVLGGIAGSFYSVVYLGMYTEGIIGGRGWIAFAICFLGNWNPIGAIIGALIFGVAESIAIYMQSSGGGFLPNEVFIALPYILTIILTISRKQFNVPAKLGVSYVKEN
ncbi:ABC transporter permease [Sediminispirochaeta smaragdinae]|jgi:simple sugar transport system permease protein|uniref:Inner-membrane translocator n=1 Tax=Sediminispirochaeta smaragdinae (strain DSM 11293 / JCM 15392 / SEBR 4228) TaxID=573413 RepID=E1R2X8_SEDSS|nr:ABC transporter permease [Sediminispirochaeta smaragdinae]ADK80410.1 inner-membrane translocator [Sediminispirochaeta smaragdinae DSM 11293]